MTFADFQSDGTTPDSNETLKILHKAGAIDELNSFKTWGCKLSGPGALCGFSLISDSNRGHYSNAGLICK